MREGRVDMDPCYAKEIMTFLFDETEINQVKIIGTSMEPTLMQGETVLFEKEYDKLEKGDIILFYNKDHFTTHRIIDIIYINGQVRYITRGDAIQSSTETIDENVIIGRIVMKE